MTGSAGCWISPPEDCNGMAQRTVKVKTLKAFFFENADRENNFEVEKVGLNNSVIWNHWDSYSILVDLNQTNSDQPIPANLKNIGSIHDTDDMCAIENILKPSLHLVHTPPLVPT